MDLSAALGIPVETYDWGDPLNTYRSQLIISDTYTFGEMKFLKDTELQSNLKLPINFAGTIHKPHRVLIVTLNKRMHNVVKSWQSRGEIPKETMTTYYRSKLSRGITIDPRHRFLVLIGGPYLRKTAYLAEAFDTDKQSAFKRSDMKSAFINLIGRVKDPKGQEKSVVFAAGIRTDEIKAFVTQAGIPSPWIVSFQFQGADSLDFETVAGIFLHPPITVEDWKTLQRDLPILARIMDFTLRKKRRVTLSEIFRLKVDNKFLQQLVTQHRSYLEKLGFRVIAESRGLSFEKSKTTE